MAHPQASRAAQLFLHSWGICCAATSAPTPTFVTCSSCYKPFTMPASVCRLPLPTRRCLWAYRGYVCTCCAEQFREREVRKRYVAMVHGVLSADEGEVDLPLCRNTGCPPLHMVNREHGKPSLTTW